MCIWTNAKPTHRKGPRSRERVLHPTEFLEPHVERAKCGAYHRHLTLFRQMHSYLPHMGNKLLQLPCLKVQNLDGFVHNNGKIFDPHKALPSRTEPAPVSPTAHGFLWASFVSHSRSLRWLRALTEPGKPPARCARDRHRHHREKLLRCVRGTPPCGVPSQACRGDASPRSKIRAPASVAARPKRPPRPQATGREGHAGRPAGRGRHDGGPA